MKASFAAVAFAIMSSLPLMACEPNTACPRLSACKVDQPLCQQHIMSVAACLRQVVPLPLPTIEIVEAASEAEMAAAEIRASPINLQDVVKRRGFSLLGLAGGSETDLTLENEHLSRLGGYFDGAKVVLLVNSWNTDAEKTKLLLHELVHVLQVPDLKTMPQQKSFDGFLAGRAIVEGEATVIADLAVLEAQGVSAEVIDLQTFYWRQLSKGKPPNIIADAYGQFTYRYGAYYMSRLSVKERRNVWQDMPTTTREVMRPGLVDEYRVKRILVHSPVLPATFTRTSVANLGNWIWQSGWRESLPLALRASVCPTYLPDIVQDTFTIFHDEATGEIVAAWRVSVDPDQKNSIRRAFEQLMACFERRPDVIVGTDDEDLWIVATSRPDRAPPVLGWEVSRQDTDAGPSDAGADASDTRLGTTADASRDGGQPNRETLDATVDQSPDLNLR
jgi:hypothetical protein